MLLNVFLMQAGNSKCGLDLNLVALVREMIIVFNQVKTQMIEESTSTGMRCLMDLAYLNNSLILLLSWRQLTKQMVSFCSCRRQLPMESFKSELLKYFNLIISLILSSSITLVTTTESLEALANVLNNLFQTTQIQQYQRSLSLI
ncbi:Hypothetical_protein [Hexamita inflata]|uniref:Hypothetical_protein n=1 Tax=Hexamita inflata TaxID=28002 RepID=A0AA86NRW8_9EUKA|nr:Hypothetical protein HINF_LOCUS13017 [Hexamita inflata]